MKESKTYYDLKNSKRRISVNQGGTRSGKTYSILKILIAFSYQNADKGLVISIVRKTLPSLRQTALRDFEEILQNEGLYNRKAHNKSDNTYKIFGNTFEFFSIDQAQKVRGSKRDILFINEANELTWDEFFQLNIRTRLKVILDYNPSMEDHWIYDKVIVREDADFFITTYLDNPFLSKLEIREIEMLQETDEFYWTVFGKGERGSNPARILYYKIAKVPDNARFLGYGMDFGFTNSQTTLVGLWEYDKGLYAKQYIYETGLTNQDISEKLGKLNISKFDDIYCDGAEPKSVEELRRLGWKAHSVKDKNFNYSIDLLKRRIIYLTPESSDMQREFRLYKWKQDREGNLGDMPVKQYDHCIDALRYVALSTIRVTARYAIR